MREAVDAYERFVAGALGDTDEPEVRARIAVLRQRLAESVLVRVEPALEPVVVAAPAPLPDRTSLSARRRLYTWIVGGTGAALLVGALAAGIVAHGRYGDLQSNCAPDGACDVVKVPDAQGLIDGGKASSLASDVLLGVGVAAVAAGVVLYFVEGRRLAERRAWITPTVSATGAGVSIGGAW